MTTKYLGWGGLRLALAACAAIALFVVLPATAQGATPTIVNNSDVSGGQKQWLESFTMGLENNDQTRDVRITLLVKHDIGRKVTGLKIDDDNDGTDETLTVGTTTLTGAQTQQPTVSGGYGYTRVTYQWQASIANSGITGSTRRKSDRKLNIRAVLDNGDTTATSTSDIRGTAATNSSGTQDYPFIYWRGVAPSHPPTDVSVTPGTQVEFRFTCDDPDGDFFSSDDDCRGADWRLRNVLTGATVDPPGSSFCPNGDNSRKDLFVTFPSRGRWVVEGELQNENGACGSSNANPGYWWLIGSADVNSTAAPTVSLSPDTNRPNTNGNVVLTAANGADPDSANGGRTEYAEWDLDNNGSFETVSHGDAVTGLSSPQQTIDTTGMTPGVHTARVQITDNGALGGADNIRRTSSVATTTFTVNSLPVVGDQAITAEAGVGKAVSFGATDADSDSLGYTITDLPDHGVLSGSGGNRTYTANVNYAGPDSFTVEVNDGHNGTDTATITIQVAPQTVIDSGPNGPHDSPNANFAFSSPAPGPVTFECSFNGAPFSPCSSPQNFTGLAEGTYTFEVRATAAGNTDPTPAINTFTVDVTVPETTIDVDPGTLTNDATPTFEFSSNEPGSTFRCRVDGGTYTTCPSPYTTPSLSDSSHTFEVYAVDPAGNEDPTPATHTFTVDTTPPDTTIDSGPSGPTSTSAPQYTFSSPDNTASFECKIDGGAFNPCTSPWTTPTMPDGPHTIQIRAVDPAGNADPTPASRSIVIDTTPPDTTIDSGPGPFTNDDTPQFQFSSPDMSASFQCRVDGGAYSPCSSPHSTATLTEGSHTFYVRAVDPAGNIDPTPSSSTFMVDTSPPATTITSGPSGATTDDTPTYEFTSDEAGSTFECRVDSDPFAPCTSPHTTASLPDGAHTFEVRAIDQAGNVDPTPASRTITVDTVAPGTSIDSGPTGTINASTATYTFSSGDGTAGFECKLDSGDWEECVSPQTYNDIPEGAHTFTVRAVDPAGNADPSPPAANFTVSTVAPETSIDSGPTGTISDTNATLAFSSDDNAATFECRLDGAAFAPCTSPVNLSGLSEGAHAFRVRAIDADNNVDQTPATRSWTVDTTGPVASIDAGPSGTVKNTSPSFEFSADEPGSTFECRVDSDPFAPCTSPKGLSGLSDASHTFEVRATDAVGNVGSPASRTFTVDTTPPDTNINSGPSGTTSATSATFGFTSTESGSTFTCTLDGNATPCSSPKSYTGLGNGSHTFKVAATDAAGNKDQTPDERTWTVSVTTPQTQITAGPAATVMSRDVSFEFDSSASPATFECALDNGAFAACTSPKSYSGLATGEHTFSVRSTNGDNVTDPTPATRTFTVADPTPPVAKQPPKIEVVSGKLKLKKLKKSLQVATITCITGPCDLSAASASIKAGKTKATLTPTAGTIAAGSTGAVMLKLKGKIYKAIKTTGKAKIAVSLEANSPIGSTKATTKLKLKTKKKKKG